MRQWNYVLNGSVRFTAKLLPEDPSSSDIAQIKRSGGWIVAKVFSVTWLCFAFAGVAIAEGWREGRKNVRRPGG